MPAHGLIVCRQRLVGAVGGKLVCDQLPPVCPVARFHVEGIEDLLLSFRELLFGGAVPRCQVKYLGLMGILISENGKQIVSPAGVMPVGKQRLEITCHYLGLAVKVHILTKQHLVHLLVKLSRIALLPVEIGQRKFRRPGSGSDSLGTLTNTTLNP